MKKLLIVAALLSRWEMAAAASIGGAAGITAALAGLDPWTWVIGGFGAAVVYVKRPATSKMDAIINSGISVFLAGLVSPWLALYLSVHVAKELGNAHPIAFILSSAWPWVAPIALNKFKDHKQEEKQP